MRRHATLALLSIGLLSMPATMTGCLVHRSKHVSYTGTPVEHSDLSRVRIHQTTTGDVQTLLGPPTATSANDDGTEVWTWRWRKTTEGQGRVFLLFAGEKSKSEDEAVHIRFKNGVAVDKWRG